MPFFSLFSLASRSSRSINFSLTKDSARPILLFHKIPLFAKVKPMNYPPHLLKLIDALRRLPGVGMKSAERYAFEILDWPREKVAAMAEIIRQTPDHLKYCQECGGLTEEALCPLCKHGSTRENILCIVAMPRDVFAIEATHEYRGLYHVLGALLSPLDRVGPESINLGKLKERVAERQIREVIIALDSTLEGDATALYVKQELEPLQLGISRLAFGLPMGSSLDYVDGGTLARALSARARF